MREIRPGVFTETSLWGCNPGVVVSGKRAVFIDSPARPEEALGWRRKVEEKAEILCLINTESHIDHTTSNFIFQDKPIIAHRRTREALASDTAEQIRELLLQLYPEPIQLPSHFAIVLPQITFEESLTIHFEDITLNVLHMPGHTPGQSCVYIPERKVLFTGDNVFHRVQTFLHDSSPHEWLSSLERMKEMDVEIIVPGHGEICDLSYVEEQISFIREWLNQVREAVKKKWSLEEAKERISFLDRYPVDAGLEGKGEWVQHINIERLYLLFKEER